MIKFFLFLTILLIPSSLVYLNFYYVDIPYKLFFSIFVLLVMVERIWETFFTFKDKTALKYKGDWTLILTLFTYLLTGLFMIFEFFYVARGVSYIISIFGFLLFLISGLIRFWSIFLLKEQWSIHAIGKAKDMNVSLQLIKNGPYRFMRHPIYTATILELVSLSLIFNTFYTIIFIIFGINFYILRAKYEEKSLIDIFGEEYLKYKEDVPFLFPSRIKLKR